jgi:hypothetical protein
MKIYFNNWYLNDNFLFLYFYTSIYPYIHTQITPYHIIILIISLLTRTGFYLYLKSKDDSKLLLSLFFQLGHISAFSGVSQILILISLYTMVPNCFMSILGMFLCSLLVRSRLASFSSLEFLKLGIF